MPHRDERDLGEPREKSWQEFRASFASALLHAWLLRELDELAPDYFQDLHRRIVEGQLAGRMLAEEDEGAYPEAIIQGPAGRSALFIELDEAELLEEQLFPHANSEGDHNLASRGLVLVGLHGALLAYWATFADRDSNRSLPEGIRDYVKRYTGSALPADLSDALIELDETRNVVVHNRGLVSAKYINNVPFNRLILGERKPIANRDVQRFAETVWQVASALHRLSGSSR